MSHSEVQENAEGAKIRSNIYGFLSSMFREEITAERLRQIKAPVINKQKTTTTKSMKYLFLN